jgi:hypothetical protein
MTYRADGEKPSTTIHIYGAFHMQFTSQMTHCQLFSLFSLVPIIAVHHLRSKGCFRTRHFNFRCEYKNNYGDGSESSV